VCKFNLVANLDDKYEIKRRDMDFSQEFEFEQFEY
jgi:hypothetical protein